MRRLLARHRADDLVAFGGEGARTAGELAAYARALAAALPEHAPGSRVVLAVSDRYRFAAALLACWQRGLVPTLPHNGQPETVRELARSSDVCALLHDRSEPLGLDIRPLDPAPLEPALGRSCNLASSERDGLGRSCNLASSERDDVGRSCNLASSSEPAGPEAVSAASAATATAETVVFEGARLQDRPNGAPPELARLQDRPSAECVLVAHTSGSTGLPQAHGKTAAQLLDEAEVLVEAFALAGHRMVVAVPPHHIYGLLFGVVVPLLSGGSMSRTSPLHPSEVLHELATHGADVLVAVPPHLGALATFEAAPWPAMHRVFSSGAPLPEGTDRALAARSVTVTQVLGSTETGGIAFRTSTSAPWTTLPRVRIEVLDDDVLGVSSPWATPKSGDLLRTPDRVELVPGGFRHLGRADSVVKVGGRRVDLGDIEARLKAIPGVRDARVVTIESRRARGLDVCAAVEGDPSVITARTLKLALAPHLDPVTLPRRYRIVSELPRTAAGKLDKRNLEALFDTLEFPREERSDESVSFAVPANSAFFRGHFEAQPILPGVVQLHHLALAEVRRRYPELGAVARVTRVKFKRPIAPGDELVLELSRRGDVQVHFTMHCGEEPAASGTFHFRRAAT